MTSTRWTALLEGRTQDPEDVLEGLRLVIGAVHRLVWSGPDTYGDRKRAMLWVREGAAALDTANPGLAAILDWWLILAAGEPPIKHAWSIDRALPAPTGEALKRMLEAGRGLQSARRPARLREVIKELQTTSDRNPGKIATDKAIIQAANDECKKLLRAAKNGSPPLTNLRLQRLDEASLNAWASEGVSSRRVEPGTPVWEHLLKQLTYRAELVKEATRLWADRRPPLALPEPWEAQVREVTGDGAELAIALLADALPVQPARPLLAEGTPRERLREPPPPAALGPALRVAREAWADAPTDRPDWLVQGVERYEQLAGELERRDYAGEPGAMLREARQLLLDARLDDAAQWLHEAELEQRRQVQGVEDERLRERAREQAAQLRDIGQPVPEQEDAAAWGLAVERAWNDARTRYKREAEAAGSELVAFARYPVHEIEAALDEAKQLFERGQLPPAVSALQRVRAGLLALRIEDDRRLGPELTRLRGRILMGPQDQRPSLLRELSRVTGRRDAGLDFEADRVALGQLVEALERRNLPAAVCLEDGGRTQRLAWAPTGVPTTGEEPRGCAVKLHDVRVSSGAPSDVIEQVRAWARVLPRPEDTGGTLFLRVSGQISGPYVVKDGVCLPQHAWRAVGALPERRFDELFGLTELGGGRALCPHPPTLPELVQVGAALRDLLDDATLAAWLGQAVEGAPSPEAIRRWLAANPLAELPQTIAAARLARLSELLGTAELLAAHREAAITQFLSSEAGQHAIQVATERVVLRDVAQLQDEVARRREELEADLTSARAALEDARRQLQDADELLADRKLRLFAELGLRQGPSAAAAPAVSAPLRAAGFTATEVPDLPALIRDLAGPTWAVDDVANLLLSMVTGRWTLLAGLPGVGKSTFVRSVLSRLGHGPGTERYLELVVRRDWQDDAALFGFWHPTERAWTPSSEGFVEQLLRAHDDERLGHGGLWPVLIEELNLASPEYYLARPISAFESANPELRLYDPDLAPVNAARYPASFVVPDNVRLVATVNVDDTVERLSPRFLSRASVIWVEPSDAAPWRPEDDAPRHRVRWGALRALTERAEADLGPIEEVVRFLQEQRIPGAPTVRTRRAIARYLAASRGLLSASDAADLQILQRILPPVRGTGPRWRGLLERLAALLDRHGWRRSAARTRELRARGEELGDWYDFFHA